jgi:hypothetical protein
VVRPSISTREKSTVSRPSWGADASNGGEIRFTLLIRQFVQAILANLPSRFLVKGGVVVSKVYDSSDRLLCFSVQNILVGFSGPF